MLSHPRTRIVLIVSAVLALAAGGITAVAYRQHLPLISVLSLTDFQNPLATHYKLEELTALSPEILTQVANQPQISLDRSRARYLLALQNFSSKPAEALRWLQNLDQDYPLLAPHILSLQAQLQQKLGNEQAATEIWQRLLENYSTSPIVAEGLAALGKTKPEYQKQLLSQWPAHPLAIELALKRLEKDPDNLNLLLQVARHGLYTFKIGEVLDRLVTKHEKDLKPEDWQTIAFGYWEKLNYPQAAKAYAKATVTPRNLYRAARSYQIADQTEKALTYYQQLAQRFPKDPETALGLKRLATLLEDRDAKQALVYWDQLYNNFPDKAGEALLGKAETLEHLGSKASASQARQSVLTQYSASEGAAQIRWTMAQSQAKAGQMAQAATIAQAIVQLNPKSELAPKAGFWAGRWWINAGQSNKAKKILEQVLRDYPESYFAWRSAVFLNLPVGNFNTVWRLQPKVTQSASRSPLPVGSDLLKELYQLGADSTAWRLWQVEFTNPMTPTVAEQFTDGLIRIGAGDYLDGIFMLTSLAGRESSQEQAEYQALRQEVGFWEGLYPLPFSGSIETWSSKRQLNPLLVTALIRQESRFMPGIVSSAGATGLMQVMPDTGDWVASKVGLQDYKLNDPDDSVNLGTWYLNYTHEEWQGNSLLAVASYNAGPGNVQDWLIQFNFKDPDIFVEQIPFTETQDYVEAVFENYWNYLRLYNPEISSLVARYSPHHLSIAMKPSPDSL
jgi:soluble lytic murein transglycosylase